MNDLKTTSETKGSKFWNGYVAGVALGIVLFLSFVITSHGLGASGGVHRIVTQLQDLIMPNHVNMTAYLAHMAGGDKNPLDSWLVIAIAGIMIGGMTSGLIHGRLKLETFKGPKITNKTRWIFALFGGMLMGYGARLARGCTSGQGLSGGSMLSVGSWAFLFAVFAGGFAMAFFVRRLWR